MIKFSIIVAYRNRDLFRVKNSLESLANQKLKDFELIFVDYGSELEIVEELKKLVEAYSFAKYIYNDTRGMFWNRAHALNTGITIASAEKAILWDIDLIVEPHFLEKLCQIDTKVFFTTHRCYYLPKEANSENYKTNKILKDSNAGYVGLCLVDTSILQNISGFDEFYQVWGAEDDDLYKRLAIAGINRKQIDVDEIPVYHQWHQSQSPALPDMWYLKMVEKLFSSDISKNLDWGKIYTQNDRPALNVFINNSWKSFIESKLNLESKTFLYNDFISDFEQLKANEGLYLKFEYPQLEFSALSQKLISRFNNFMQKRKLNLRLINQLQNERNNLKENIYSFLKYFIGINRQNISDYYLDLKENEFKLIIILSE